MFEFRQATEDDWDFLVLLRRTTMGAHIDRAGVDYDEEFQTQRIRHKYDCAQIVVLDGEDIGLLKVSKEADPWQLIQIQLAPGFQGRGLGTALLDGVLAAAQEEGVAVELRVYKTNPAKRLYERRGFVVVGQSERGFAMRWEG